MKIDRICVDPGHGGRSPGATFAGLKEKDVTLKVAREYQGIMGSLGWRVGGREGPKYITLTRWGDTYRSLQERCDIANDIPSDLFISLHTNADRDEDDPGMPEAKGEEIWYCSRKGKKIAEVFQEAVDNFFPGKFRGVKKGNFDVIKYTHMPAILIEMGFIDNVAENKGFTSDYKLKRIALLLATATLKLEATEI